MVTHDRLVQPFFRETSNILHSMKYSIGFIGAGKMGGAILSGITREKAAPASVLVCDARAEALAPFVEKGFAVTGDPLDVARQCPVIFVAVKPQDFDALLSSMAPALRKTQLVVSIAAGKTLAKMRRLLGHAPRLARVMPNLAASVGEGVMSFVMDSSATPRDRKLVESLLSCCGIAVALEERLFDAVTALGGSGPAFFAYALDAMAKGGEALGFSSGDAAAIALQTMLGTAKYLKETGQDTASFIKAVCSPHGTTEAGMKVLGRSSVAAAFAKTLAAAAKRSAELQG